MSGSGSRREEGEDPLWVKTIGDDRAANETGELFGARTYFLRIEDAFREALEESGRSVLQNVAARTDDGGAWSDRLIGWSNRRSGLSSIGKRVTTP